ncbi:type II secretion system protein [Epidermidibacterium keratini]|uniref:Type II secretion system protein n=1 Tax=Epidermidibacterium keratini TaxID=1891644 RepID=A0A7L4YML2_9ACTN|nr:type II secretion system F family protein [Epidermidibacterium keratini]QHC00074.1 type II secretion system protein [Epidermidibacterium keratini]
MSAVALFLLGAALWALPGVRRTALPLGPSLPVATRSSRSRSIPKPMLAGLLGLAVALTVGGTGGAVAGTVAAAIALLLLRRSASAAAAQAARDQPDLDGALTVAALLLRSGSPPAQAMVDATRVFPIPAAATFAKTQRLIALGHPPVRAWQEAARDSAIRPIASAAVRSSASGAALAEAWSALARQARADRESRAEVRAQRTGIAVLAPLGLCFLPAFVCIGVVPIVVGLAGDIFG